VCHYFLQVLMALRSQPKYKASRTWSLAALWKYSKETVWEGQRLSTICSILVVPPVSMMDGSAMVRKGGVRKHCCLISLSRKTLSTRQIQEHMGRKVILLISALSVNSALPQGNGATVIMLASSIPTTSCKSPRFGFNNSRADYSFSSADASEALGLSQIPDMNDPDNSPIGWSRMPVTRDASGHRLSTARAFLSPDVLATRHANLHVCPNTVAERLMLEKEGNDLIARSVIVGPTNAKVGDQITKQVRVRGEVVLCGGAFGSPQTLLLRFVILALSLTANLTSS